MRVVVFSFGIATRLLSAMNAEAGLSRVPEGYKEYRNEQFGFSLDYLQEIPSKESLGYGPSLTIAFQGGTGQAGFQIYAAPIEGDVVTDDRFRMDEPSGVRLDPKNTTVGGCPRWHSRDSMPRVKFPGPTRHSPVRLAC